MASDLPLLVSPQNLAARLGGEDLLIVDLGKARVHEQAHVPGAVHLDFRQLLRGTQPAPGLLPEREQLKAPTIIIVGEVVQLQEKLSWFGKE